MVAELFFGPTYGQILGIFLGVDTLSAAAGIVVVGEIRVASGSYIPAIHLMLVLAVIAIVCVFLVKQLSRRSQI
jgi:uncharacterized membrane protein